MLRGLIQLQVNRDGSSTEISETLVRIETEAGVKSYSEQSHEYNGALSNLEVLEAATIQPDGTRIDVPADRILTRDQLGEEAAVLNTDGKVKVVVFPAVAVGSQLLLRLKTTQHTPEFPGHFISASYFSPHSRYESYTVELSHDPQIAIRVDAPGMTGGKLSTSAESKGQSDDLVRYRYVFRQPQALPEELGELDDSDFAPGFSATSFASWEDLGRAYQARARPKAEVTDAIRAQALKIAWILGHDDSGGVDARIHPIPRQVPPACAAPLPIFLSISARDGDDRDSDTTERPGHGRSIGGALQFWSDPLLVGVPPAGQGAYRDQRFPRSPLESCLRCERRQELERIPESSAARPAQSGLSALVGVAPHE